MNLNQFHNKLLDIMDAMHIAGIDMDDVTVVQTLDDFTGEGEVLALDQIDLNEP